MEDETVNDEQPTAETVVGDADSTVIEPGGTDNSFTSESQTDESVNLTIVNAEDSGSEDLAMYRQEHMAVHTSLDSRITDLETKMADLSVQSSTEQLEEELEEHADNAPAETVIQPSVPAGEDDGAGKRACGVFF